MRRLRWPHSCICEVQCQGHQSPRNGDKIVKIKSSRAGFQFYHRDVLEALRCLVPECLCLLDCHSCGCLHLSVATPECISDFR